MQPSGFDEANATLGPPRGMRERDPSGAGGPDEVGSLQVMQATVDGAPVVISCWKPSREELEEVQRTGRVWLVVYGETMPPAHVSGLSPFREEA